jgi:uncharacterized protein
MKFSSRPLRGGSSRGDTGILILAQPFSTTAGAASFDCTKAATEIETAICSDNSLSTADETLAELYERLSWLKAGDQEGLKQLAAEQND